MRMRHLYNLQMTKSNLSLFLIPFSGSPPTSVELAREDIPTSTNLFQHSTACYILNRYNLEQLIK